MTKTPPPYPEVREAYRQTEQAYRLLRHMLTWTALFLIVALTAHCVSLDEQASLHRRRLEALRSEQIHMTIALDRGLDRLQQLETRQLMTRRLMDRRRAQHLAQACLAETPRRNP